MSEADSAPKLKGGPELQEYIIFVESEVRRLEKEVAAQAKQIALRDRAIENCKWAIRRFHLRSGMTEEELASRTWEWIWEER